MSMYKHLLVPLEDTPLSSLNVANSVELARTLGARITFFHAAADYAATEDGALLLTLDPERFAQSAPGATNAMLAKAMACARGAGVPCSAAARTSDHPARAIVETAQQQGCDLIVMASRGPSSRWWRGSLHHSETERVLRQSPVALLVTRVAAEQPLSHREQAIGTIIDEHRSIAVVVGAMRDIARELGDKGVVASELAALEGMASYLRRFPTRQHHPKEEDYLHRRMLARNPGCATLLQEVEAQHEVERVRIDEVTTRLATVTAPGGVRALVGAVERFAEHVFTHLRLEESEVLPLAQECLHEDDWATIAEAFSSNDDSRFSELSSAEFRRLFTRIADGIAARGRRG